MLETDSLRKRAQKGMTYPEYLNNMKKKAAQTGAVSLDEDPLIYYTRLNFQRSARLEKTYRLSDKLRTLLRRIDKPQLWMVLTEAWCGDSAQSLPMISKMAKENPRIELRILLRDENPDIMNQYLTNGKQGIPKLVVFDKTGNELFTWGPRPREAAELFARLQHEGWEKGDIYQELHKWYARDKGKSIEHEFIEILNAHLKT